MHVHFSLSLSVFTSSLVFFFFHLLSSVNSKKMMINKFVLYSLLPLYLHLLLSLLFPFSSFSFSLSLHQLIDVFAGHLKSNERFEAALQLKSLCGGLSAETVSEN